MSGPKLVAWFLLVAGPPLAASLHRVWVRQDNVLLGYQLSQAEQHSEALRTELRKLEVARADGRTPQRIMAMARRLGLAPPRAEQFVATPASNGLLSDPSPAHRP